MTAVAVPAVAPAATTFVIRGAGYGHGVGMSQYGTYGFAKRGRAYDEILAHYYTGTELSKLASDPKVRVLLQQGSSFSFSGATRASGRRLSAATTYHAVRTGFGRVQLKSPAGRVLKTFDTPMRVTGPSGVVLNGTSENGITGGRYRGVMLFQDTAVGFQAVNSVGLEDYVSGVVSAESPASWPLEALKAQAVAARTYAITTGGGTNFDQYADTRSQMYVGVGGEYESTEAAVDATRGEIVTYDGEPVVTYFFSTSGGRTENVENSFIGSDPKPWLKSVEDPYDTESPKHRWGPLRYSMSAAAAKLSGYVKGTFRGISVVQRGESPRIVYADVVGTGGRTRVTGPTLRARFGLDDTWATFNVISTRGTKRSTARAAGAGRSLRGHVGWVDRPTIVTVQRRGARGWKPLFELATDRRGRYRVGDLDRGRYRIRWRGTAGPVVGL